MSGSLGHSNMNLPSDKARQHLLFQEIRELIKEVLELEVIVKNEKEKKKKNEKETLVFYQFREVDQR